MQYNGMSCSLKTSDISVDLDWQQVVVGHAPPPLRRHPEGQTILVPNRPETCYSEDEPLGEPRERFGGDLAGINQPTNERGGFHYREQREASSSSSPGSG